MRYLYAFILTAMSLPVFATIVEHHGFVQDDWNNGYPEQRYHFVLDKIIEIYTPIIEAKGGTFHILRDWGDGSVNAWAWRIADEYHLEVPGGMSRFHLINEEAFILVVCHEIGHLLGGAPARNSTISLEGQADYFASTHCMKRILPQLEAYKPVEASDDIIRLCEKSQDSSICIRTLAGAQALSNYFSWIVKEPFPEISRESGVVVSRTITSHPPAQCRLDTYKRGAFCKAREEYVSFEDANLGYCHQPQNKRPQCWYAIPKFEEYHEVTF